MARLRIQGQKPLSGSVRVQGMKNAALPAIAATLLTREPCVLRNVPRLSDVDYLLELLQSLGAHSEWTNDHELRIETAGAQIQNVNRAAFAKLRGSMFLLGPLLARFGMVAVHKPGGDQIGSRPLDRHIRAFHELGAEIREQDGFIELQAREGLHAPAKPILPDFSVGATENAIMASVTAAGATRIETSAMEPQVEDLIGMLTAMGARIDGAGTHTLMVHGVSELRGFTHTLIPDRDVTGTFAVAAVATRGTITLTDVNPNHCTLFLDRLRLIGATVEVTDSTIAIDAASKELRPFQYQAYPYPGLPTDLQAPFGVLATQCTGTSLIHDPVYNGRFGYVNELLKMGANAVICDPHRALITGPTPLTGTEVTSLDIRAGATLVIAGLIACGETVIHHAEVLDRGYERLEECLRGLGADVRREE